MNNLARRLWREHMRPYAAYFVFAVVLMAIVALSTAALPYLLQPVFDDILSSHAPEKLFGLCSLVLGTFLVKGAASYGESVVMAFIGQRLVADIQYRLFSHILTLDLAFFHTHPSGEIVSRLTQDVALMRQSISHSVISVGKDTLTLVGLIAVMCTRDPMLAFLALVGFPLAIYPMICLGKRLRSLTNKSQNEIGRLTSHLIQVFQGVRVVKGYTQESRENQTVKGHIEELFRFSFQSMKTRSIVHPIMEAFAGFAIVGVVIVGGWQVMSHTRTTGEFVSFIGALLLLYEPLKRLSHLNSTIQEGLSSATRIFAWLDLRPTIQELPNCVARIQRPCRLRFDDVSFGYHYPTKTISNISFTLEPGRSIAFVGESGAGKSTIINLIPRFYDVNSGCILINDIDIRSLSLSDLRSHVALVSQDIVLFEGTVMDNLRYGSSHASTKEVKDAADMAASTNFIEALPHGYDTQIGENGVKLSGGQRQRIAIIRAMLKNAPILLLDEATSALDTLSEHHIQTSLKFLMKGRATLSVAHRLVTIMDADQIFVIDRGTIVGVGTHETLLKENPTYQRLYKEMQTIRK